MDIYSIYKATNKINGKCYIGFTSNWEKRWQGHKVSAFKKNSSHPIHKALRKYGPDNFDWQVIYQSLDRVHCLSVMEHHFIVQYRSHTRFDDCNGYNQTLGGEGRLGHSYIPSPESNLKRSHTLTGRIMTEEHKQKIGSARQGLKFNKEWCANIANSRQGKTFSPLSDDHKRKISESNKKPKPKCSCINCHRTLSVNALKGNHKC